MTEFDNLKNQINLDIHQQYGKFLLDLLELSIPKEKIEGLAGVPTLAQIKMFLNERLKFFPVSRSNNDPEYYWFDYKRTISTNLDQVALGENWFTLIKPTLRERSVDYVNVYNSFPEEVRDKVSLMINLNKIQVSHYNIENLQEGQFFTKAIQFIYGIEDEHVYFREMLTTFDVGTLIPTVCHYSTDIWTPWRKIRGNKKPVEWNEILNVPEKLQTFINSEVSQENKTDPALQLKYHLNEQVYNEFFGDIKITPDDFYSKEYFSAILTRVRDERRLKDYKFNNTSFPSNNVKFLFESLFIEDVGKFFQKITDEEGNMFTRTIPLDNPYFNLFVDYKNEGSNSDSLFIKGIKIFPEIIDVDNSDHLVSEENKNQVREFFKDIAGVLDHPFRWKSTIPNKDVFQFEAYETARTENYKGIPDLEIPSNYIFFNKRKLSTDYEFADTEGSETLSGSDEKMFGFGNACIFITPGTYVFNVVDSLIRYELTDFTHRLSYTLENDEEASKKGIIIKNGLLDITNSYFYNSNSKKGHLLRVYYENNKKILTQELIFNGVKLERNLIASNLETMKNFMLLSEAPDTFVKADNYHRYLNSFFTPWRVKSLNVKGSRFETQTNLNFTNKTSVKPLTLNDFFKNTENNNFDNHLQSDYYNYFNQSLSEVNSRDLFYIESILISSDFKTICEKIKLKFRSRSRDVTIKNFTVTFKFEEEYMFNLIGNIRDLIHYKEDLYNKGGEYGFFKNKYFSSIENHFPLSRLNKPNSLMTYNDRYKVRLIKGESEWNDISFYLLVFNSFPITVLADRDLNFTLEHISLE